jgi:hypothetical protein
MLKSFMSPILILLSIVVLGYYAEEDYKSEHQNTVHLSHPGVNP